MTQTKQGSTTARKCFPKLAYVFHVCSNANMLHESPPIILHAARDQIAVAILSAAGWARVGITIPDERMRTKAAEELALTIIEHVDPQPEPDTRQLPLFR